MATLTPHFGWLLPAVNDPIDQDQWGDQLNSNISNQDTLVYALSTTSIGTSRPTYAAAGTQWVDNTANPWIWKMYDGTVDIVLGNIDTVTNTFTPSGSAALTTKGDLLTYSTLPVRLGVGLNGQVITADSTQATGIKWSNGNSVGAWFSATVNHSTHAVTILAQNNVSSITNVASVSEGCFIVNFATALPSANYAASGIGERLDNPTAVNNDVYLVIPRRNDPNNSTGTGPTAAACPVYLYDAGSTPSAKDCQYFSMIFVGG